MKLIPFPKTLVIEKGCLKNKKIFIKTFPASKRLLNALRDMKLKNEGTPVEIFVNGAEGEGYTLEIGNRIIIEGESEQGAFYGIQTLKQLFESKKVPYLYIKDSPDFPHRGFYHDITRGKVPKLETLKKLIDKIAYFKMNSLQLYVEDTCELKEYDGFYQKEGYITKKELKELDLYCKERFIDFIPSLSTFGHLYGLLENEECLTSDYLQNKNKSVIMWTDIFLKHPEKLKELPKDIIFLNRNYCDVNEESFSKLSMYNLALGAGTLWNNETKTDDNFRKSVNSLIYKDFQKSFLN